VRGACKGARSSTQHLPGLSRRARSAWGKRTTSGTNPGCTASRLVMGEGPVGGPGPSECVRECVRQGHQSVYGAPQGHCCAREAIRAHSKALEGPQCVYMCVCECVCVHVRA